MYDELIQPSSLKTIYVNLPTVTIPEALYLYIC